MPYFTFPLGVYEGYNFSTCLSAFVIYLFFFIAILVEVKWYHIVSLISISQITYGIEHLCMCYLSALEKSLFKSLAHFFKIWVIVELKEFFTYSRGQTLIIYIICTYILSSCELFHFFDSILGNAEVFNLDEVQFFCFFSFVAWTFGIISTNPLKSPSPWTFTPLFSS